MIALALYAAILAVKALLAWWYARKYPAPRLRTEISPVAVCQAILSGDPDLQDALESNLASAPQARFVWLIDDDDEEAGRLVTELAGRHCGRDIRILSSPPPPEGINPKLFKLERARDAVSGGIFLVLDDDTRLGPSSVGALIDALDRCELATGLPFYRDGGNLFGRLLGQFVNNNSALTYLPLLPFVRPVSINGMCYALKTEHLARLGGFDAIMRHLTDDLAVAERVRDAGGRIIQTPFPQEVATTLDSLPRYMAQMHRWYLFALLLMRRQSAAMNLVIGALYGAPPLLLAAAIVEVLLHPSWAALGALAAVLGARALILCALQWRLSGKVRHRPLLSLLSELLQPLHLAHAAIVKSIRWRSRRYRVHDNDRFVSI